MRSTSPATPNPMSPGGIAAQMLWFGGNPKPTLCGLAATRHVNVFAPGQASCRECRARWQRRRSAVPAVPQPRPAAPASGGDYSSGALRERAVQVDALISVPCPDCDAPAGRGCTAASGRTEYVRLSPQVDAHATWLAAALAAGTVPRETLIAQFGAGRVPAALMTP
ncbi:MAG: hypothetical protein ABR926_27530 [Streptosporangiaceae bacterium]|jgi:hypothetical protein